MRSKRSRMADTRTKVHIFTGGLKEDVAQIELRGGELIDCTNYQEIDGAYHGYSSIPGYEVTDGTTLASEVDTLVLSDYGNDRYTKLLIECDNYTDKSELPHVVTDFSSVLDPVYFKFFGQSFAFSEATYISVTPNIGSTLSLNTQLFTFDLLVRPTDLTGVKTIVEKANSYRLTMEAGVFTWWFSSDGLTYDHSVAANNSAVSGVRYHIEVSRDADDNVILFINGDLQQDSDVVPVIHDEPGDLILGGSLLGNIEEVRLSLGAIRHLSNFDIPEIPYSTFGYSTFQINDTSRELQRSAITEVPGSGNILGVTIYKDCVYAVRNAVDGLSSNLWCANNGWQMQTGDMNTGGDYRWTLGKFPELANLEREEVLFFTSGTDVPKYLNGTTLVDITHPNLPDDALSSFYATNCVEFKSRLFLAYPDGRLLFSAVDNPLEFDPIAGAGEIFMEDSITDMIVGPGDTLLIFCESSTFLLKSLSDVSGAAGSVTAQYKFSKQTFSKQSGAFPKTVQRVLGTIISMNERGITSLEATDAFGDFSSAFISKNVQITLMKYKDKITGTTVQKTNNQYRIYFSDGTGLYFTFDSEKKLKGVTKVRFDTPVACIAEGTNVFGDVVIAFGSTGGFVYLMDSGTSFNGRDIKTKLTTSYNSYSSPGVRKRFRNISLELQADRDMEIFGVTSFDYGSPDVPRFSQEGFITTGTGGIWGVDRWGYFVYGSAATQNPTLYIRGYGKNMSLSIVTSDKYRKPHTINAAVVKYTFAGQVM